MEKRIDKLYKEIARIEFGGLINNYVYRVNCCFDLFGYKEEKLLEKLEETLLKAKEKVSIKEKDYKEVENANGILYKNDILKIIINKKMHEGKWNKKFYSSNKNAARIYLEDTEIHISETSKKYLEDVLLKSDNERFEFARKNIISLFESLTKEEKIQVLKELKEV